LGIAKKEAAKMPRINERVAKKKILEYCIDKWQFFSYNINIINKKE